MCTSKAPTSSCVRVGVPERKHHRTWPRGSPTLDAHVLRQCTLPSPVRCLAGQADWMRDRFIPEHIKDVADPITLTSLTRVEFLCKVHPEKFLQSASLKPPFVTIQLEIYGHSSVSYLTLSVPTHVDTSSPPHTLITSPSLLLDVALRAVESRSLRQFQQLQPPRQTASSSRCFRGGSRGVVPSLGEGGCRNW